MKHSTTKQPRQLTPLSYEQAVPAPSAACCEKVGQEACTSTLHLLVYWTGSQQHKIFCWILNIKHFREKPQSFSEVFLHWRWYKPVHPPSLKAVCAAAPLWAVQNVTSSRKLPVQPHVLRGPSSQETATGCQEKVGLPRISAHVQWHCLGELWLLIKLFFLFPLQTWPWTFLKTSSL